MDFYINSDLKWCVELLRNSNKLDEHIDRFRIGGKYHQITKISRDFMVVNFCCLNGSSSVYPNDPHYIQVNFNSDLSEATFNYLNSSSLIKF